MIIRPFWIHKISDAWQRRSIVWLSGVRRVGKTTLAKMFSNAIYLNCDLPSAARRLSDPELFYDSVARDSIIIFDEIHRLPDPSMLLKIAADEYPHLKILATGSSTLTTTRKFRDSLTGRKENIYLPPVLWTECIDTFDRKDLDRRLFHGGLPEPLLSVEKDPLFFSEWVDSFFARDIQELFGVRNRTGFITLFRLLLQQSGGMIDFTKLAKLSKLSRPTVQAHIEAMRISHAVYLVPPFFGGSKREIVRRPKCYGFDTGFVSFEKGWNEIREDDAGLLWEHLVLDFLRIHCTERDIYYWRDKSGREIDFVVREKNKKINAIECKTNPDRFTTKSLAVFRTIYPEGKNIVVCPGIKQAYSAKIDQLIVHFFGLKDLSQELKTDLNPRHV